MLKNNSIHIIGAGGYGVEIAYLVKCQYPIVNIFYYDDNLRDDHIWPIDFLIGDKEISGDCILAIGDPAVRRDIVNRVKGNSKLNFPNIDLSNSLSYPTSSANSIGVGNIIMPGAIIGLNSKVGSFNILGANVGIGHDVEIGDFNFIGPNCFLAGNSKIGDFCKLSFGSFIMQNAYLCSNIDSMPYTAFYKKYKIPGTYFGNPAKSI
jgi:hypothetical protein